MGLAHSTVAQHVLETQLGSLMGIEASDSESGKSVYRRYTRIPYAQPPVGEWRWRRPQPLPKSFTFDKATGGPGDYTEFGPVCPQIESSIMSTIILDNPKRASEPPKVQSEDCLYLNVWVPAGPPPHGGWPVEFFIHGGWLQVGDAQQSPTVDPFDLFKNTDTPRIIVSPTHRLNVFGFFANKDLAELKEDPAAGNYGFWDQRAALEWTYDHVEMFGGNRDNITVGGLSAGGYSTLFQLHYDTYLPTSDCIIKRAYFWSNSVGVQPNPIDSAIDGTQLLELLESLKIPLTLSPAEKIRRLRGIPADRLVVAMSDMQLHSFRANTDESFISSKTLQSIQDGSFTALLREHGVSILLGEVGEEELLYRLTSPADSISTLKTQLNNYYPPKVTNAMLELFPTPKPGASMREWQDVFGMIAANCQVYGTIRGFSQSLLKPATGEGLPLDMVHRYRIAWRAQSLDEWIAPRIGVCHAMDVPIWWCGGYRAGFTEDDKAKNETFLKPFGQFLKGEKVDWGTKNERQVREMGKDGVTRIVEDDNWDKGLEVWKAMLKAQA